MGRRTRSIALPALGALAALLSTASISASPAATGTLQLDGRISTKYRFDDAFCPAGASRFDRCVRFVGVGQLPGLGRATTTYTKILPGADFSCPVLNHNTAVIEVAGKGSISVSRTGRFCGPTAPAEVPPSTFTVTGGSGTYAEASGTLAFKSSVYAADFGCGPCGNGLDTWTGTLVVPGVDFDTSMPVLSGAASKTVRIPRRAERARVRYAVTATDGVDGAVPVSCSPRSGSWFRLGRTSVTCSATDSSGNTATRRFTVTVRRART